MIMLKNIFEISERFPPVSLKSSMASYASKFNVDPKRYTCFCLFAALAPAFFLSLLFIGNLFFFIAAFPLLYAMFFLFFSMLPKLAFNQKKSEVEAELPIFLRTLSMLLELKIPFHSALETLSREDFAISPELKTAVKEIKRGATVESAFAALAQADSLAESAESTESTETTAPTANPVHPHIGRLGIACVREGE